MIICDKCKGILTTGILKTHRVEQKVDIVEYHLCNKCDTDLRIHIHRFFLKKEEKNEIK